MIVYIDMDDVLCNFTEAYNASLKRAPETQFPQSVKGFFETLVPMKDAIEAVEKLRSLYDVYILTAPSTRNPLSYTEKRIWIEKHFGYEFTKKLIICSNKGLLKGDILIDDYKEGKGQENFEGKLIHFGTENCPDWESAIERITKINHG